MPRRAARPEISRRDRWLIAGLLAVIVAGLAALAAATGWQETFRALAALGPVQILILLALSVANYLARTLRWALYMAKARIPVNPLQTLRHYLGGFAMTATPGRVGEVVRLDWIARETGLPVERAAPVALMDRAADLAACGLLIAMAVAFSATGLAGGMTIAGLSIAGAIVATRARLLAAALRLAWRLIGRWPRSFVRALHAARAMRPFSDWSVALPGLALGVAGWFAEGYALWLLLGWMGVDMGLWTAVGIFLVATVGGAATGAPGGLGGAEAAMVALLSLEGVPLPEAIAATAVIRLTTLWFAVGIGLVAFPFATRAAYRGVHAG